MNKITPINLEDESAKHCSIKQAEHYYRAEVFLSEGSQEYDLVGYTKEQVLVDILNQYERHLQYLHLER